MASASGGWARNAAATYVATADARAKTQAAYDAAMAELDALNTSKPVTELQALIGAASAELVKLPPYRRARQRSTGAARVIRRRAPSPSLLARADEVIE
jgi:hypothetical protein